MLTDLALSLVLGGDALRDAALLRAEPGLYGLVVSEATISRTITTLAQDAEKALKAIATARAAALQVRHRGLPHILRMVPAPPLAREARSTERRRRSSPTMRRSWDRAPAKSHSTTDADARAERVASANRTRAVSNSRTDFCLSFSLSRSSHPEDNDPGR
ncbi:MAG: hypothetical protein H0U62_09175 [Actinobacteria bacterium]|nr:hypothetical protein [Actinomycetota bacterium]